MEIHMEASFLRTVAHPHPVLPPPFSALPHKSVLGDADANMEGLGR